MKNLITHTIKLSKMETFKFSIVKGSMKSTISVSEISYNAALRVATLKAGRLGYTVINSMVPVVSDSKLELINYIIASSEVSNVEQLRAELNSFSETMLKMILIDVKKYKLAY